MPRPKSFYRKGPKVPVTITVQGPSGPYQQTRLMNSAQIARAVRKGLLSREAAEKAKTVRAQAIAGVKAQIRGEHLPPEERAHLEHMDKNKPPKGGFTSVQAAEDWRQRVHPEMNMAKGYVPGVSEPASLGEINAAYSAYHAIRRDHPKLVMDLAGAHVAVMGPVLRSFSARVKEWPQVSQHLRRMEVAPDDAGTWAAAWTGTGATIRLNSRYFKQDPIALRSGLQRSELTGFHPPGCATFESVLDHEFGHMIHGWMQFRGDGIALHKYTDYMGTGYLSDTLMYWQSSNKKRKRASEYGKTNEAEAFAESYSSILHTPREKWAPYTRQLAKLLKVVQEVHRDGFVPRAQVKLWRDITDENERRAAKAELEKLRKRMGIK